jgi:hypothetical protein
MSLTNLDNCKECKFAIMGAEGQSDCSLGKLNFLKSPVQPIDFSYFNLSRICIFKRSEKWDGDIQKETAPKVGYIFILKDRDKLNELKENILKVKNCIWVGVYHPFEDLQKEIIEFTAKSLDHSRINIVCNFSGVDGNDLYKLDKFEKNYINGWTIVNIVGEEFDVEKLSNTLDSFVNNKMGRASIIYNKDSNSINELCFFNIYYKFYKGSHSSLDTVLDKVIHQTVIEKALQENSQLVKDWSDI